MQGKPRGGSIHMAIAWASLQSLASFLARRTKEFQGERTLTQNGQSGGERQPGHEGLQVFLIKPNQIKHVRLLRALRACPSWRAALCSLWWPWCLGSGLLRKL